MTKAYYQRIMFEAMFLLACYEFLRVGEITSRSKTYQNLLLFQEVTLYIYKSGQTTVNLKISHFNHNTSKQPVLLEIKSQAKANYEVNFYAYVEDPKVHFFATAILVLLKRSEFCSVLNVALLFANYDITD